jgi:hypothetical protein
MQYSFNFFRHSFDLVTTPNYHFCECVMKIDTVSKKKTGAAIDFGFNLMNKLLIATCKKKNRDREKIKAQRRGIFSLRFLSCFCCF